MSYDPYALDRSAYSEIKWKLKGKEYLDRVQDLDQELKVARRTTKLSVAALPITSAAIVGPLVVITFFGFSWLFSILSLIGLVVLAANGVVLTEFLGKIGATKYDNSLPHRLEQARRQYYAWLEVDAEPKPEKPTQEVVPVKKRDPMNFTNQMIQSLEDADSIIMGDGRILPTKTDVSYTFRCHTCRQVITAPDLGIIKHDMNSHRLEGHVLSQINFK